MSFIKFITSKSLLKNILAAIVLMIVLIFALKIYLGIYTHHNEYHVVPNLSKKSFEEAARILKDRKMNIEIIDTVDFNPDFPPYSIVEQNPHNQDKVKTGRTIYIKINSNRYADVRLPGVIGKTKRQAVTLLKASGFKVGKISTRPYFAEIVLYAIHKKDTLKNGSKVPKTSSIDLIIGDGKRSIEETSSQPENSTDSNIQNVLDNVIGK